MTNEQMAALALFFGAVVFPWFHDLIDVFFHRWYCRKAQYDCDFCHYWTCPAHYCRHKRAAIEERNTKGSSGVADQDSSCR